MNPHQETIDLVNAIKLAIAIAGCALLIWSVIVRRLGRPRMHRRLRDALLGTLAALSALCWSNFFQFHYSQYFHPSDLYHYYVGAKYFPELGYTKLYECTAAADIAAGLKAQPTGRLREIQQPAGSARPSGKRAYIPAPRLARNLVATDCLREVRKSNLTQRRSRRRIRGRPLHGRIAHEFRSAVR